METSFDAFLSSKPSTKELTEHVNVSTNWYLVGTMLDLDQKRLKSIEANTGHTEAHKMVEMFNLWLDTTPRASRRQVLEALTVDAVGENTLAHDYEKYLKDLYEKYLKDLYETTYAPPSTEAVSILQRNIQSLNEALVSPVQVSQLLYSKRCISEATLNEMERIDQSRSLDDKKTILLTAMQKTVSSDYRKLKDIATVLSDVEQTRDIANEMMTKYEDKILEEDDSTVVQPQEVVGGSEDCASDILRNNYSALSQSITEPVRMARLLNEEVISDEVLSCVMSTRGSVSDSRAVLLKAVRDAVHSNYKHLELFVTVLRKFSETAHIGDIIFEEYRKHFNYDDDILESEIFLAERNRDFQQRPMSTSSESSSLDDNEVDKHGCHKILFPPNQKMKFQKMRLKFGSTFFQVRRIFGRKKNVLDIDEVKKWISDCFPDLKPQLSDKMTIDEVLDVLKRKCNIINLHPLEVLAFEYIIEEAEPIIKSFKEEAKDFCNSVSVSLCLDEKLQAVATSSRLLYETVVFVIDWNPEEHTLQDIYDVLDELEPFDKLQYRLQIDKIGRGQSVVVTCYCPAEYTGSLIMAVLEKIGTMQKRGLKEFKVGNCTIWNNTTHEVSSAVTTKEIEQPTKNTVNNFEDMERELLSMKQQLAEKEKQVQELQMKLQTKQEKEDIHISPTESVDELNKKLETQYEIGRRKTMEIKDLKATMRQKDEKMIDMERDLLSMKQELAEKEKQVQELQMKLQTKQEKEDIHILPTESVDELSKKLETQYAISRRKTMEIKDLKDTMKQKDEKMIATDTEFKELSESRLKEIESLKMKLEKSQSIIVQNEEVINELKEELKYLKSFYQILLAHYLKEREEDRDVAWSQNGVLLTKPSLHQFKEVISKLENKHEIMTFSKCDNIQPLIPTILEETTIKGLFIQSSFLTCDDIVSFSSQLSTNKSLTALALSDDSISDDGVAVLAQLLQVNETLEHLILSKNRDMTSDSAQPLAELLLNNKTLKHLHLHQTNIDTDGVMKLIESLKENVTLIGLWLDVEHETICTTLPYYEQIRGILTFYN